MKWTVFASLVMLVLAAVACSLGTNGGSESISVEELQSQFNQLPAGDAARGEQLFTAQTCKTCHMDLGVGPAFPGDPPLATLAATRKAGYSAELYLYESLVAPNVHVVPGFQKDIMPAEFGTTLTEQELADLIAYLMTMK